VTITVRRFADGDAEALERLNRRMKAGGVEHKLYPEDLSKNPTADLDVRPVNHALYVVADGNELRGGAWLCEQYFWVDGARHRVGWMKYPVSESLVDPGFAGVPASMILQLLRRQPRLMVIGTGGHDSPFARLLAGVGWKSSTIPFRFRVLRPFRVLRGLTYARRRGWMRVAMDLAALSGVGWLAHRIVTAGAGRLPQRAGVTATVEVRFHPWADAIWEACRGEYHALAVRDAKTLDHIYDDSVPGLHRIRVSRQGTDIGWVCAQLLPKGENTANHFGSLEVGVLTDLLARPPDAAAVLAAGVDHLAELRADLVITYLSHSAWIDAARHARFLPGPSTFAFYRSPQAEALVVNGTLDTRCHLTRSDGDGPAR
jgi:hypothetical protein